MIDAAALARRLPDVPRWVDTRGMLLSGRAEVAGSDADEGFVVRAQSGTVSVVAVIGRPPAALIRKATADPSVVTPVISQVEDESHVAAALWGWTSEPASLHTLPRNASVPAPRGGTRLLERSDAHLLDLLPEALRQELADALVTLPVAGALCGATARSILLSVLAYRASVGRLDRYPRNPSQARLRRRRGAGHDPSHARERP